MTRDRMTAELGRGAGCREISREMGLSVGEIATAGDRYGSYRIHPKRDR